VLLSLDCTIKSDKPVQVPHLELAISAVVAWDFIKPLFALLLC
jgi:hypothetical protein